MNFLAQAPLPSFWTAENGDTRLWTMIALAFLVGVLFMVTCLFVPTRARRPIVATFTFIAGAYWVAYYLWPRPAFRGPNDEPETFVDGVGFWLADANPIVGNFAQILTAFILGLGVYSLIRIHAKRLVKLQNDWFFSLVLLLSWVTMVGFGYADFKARLEDKDALLANPDNWRLVQYGRDLLFDGMFQVMEAAMFSMIAFFILSAAYRAFRIRSIEATILLAAALIMMLSLMGALVVSWDSVVDNIGGTDPGSFANNLRLSEIASWLRNTLQTPSIRAIEFGIGIGALSMGLRLWLSLERGVSST